MGLPSLPYEQARRIPGAVFVDLRSPAEFAQDRVPGARNAPLLDNEQRAVVGTLYKRVSPALALSHGLDLVAERLPGLLARILDREVPPGEWQERFRILADRIRRGDPGYVETEPARAADLGGHPLVLYCWRGGMRSRSVTALLRAVGERGAVHLEGGHKGYRAWVRGRLGAFDPGTPLVVLRGPTGVGKTRILHALERALPGSTVDLEGLARHRSSILGDVGLEPATGRGFESGLAARLEAMGPPPWFVEGESRKVGDVIIPAPFFRAMEDGLQVRVDGSLSHRVRVLREDYLSAAGAVAQLAGRLPFLEKRLGPSWVGRLQGWLGQGDWDRIARVLLERYYDPRYARSDRRRTWAAHLDAEDPELVIRLLEIRSRTSAPDTLPSIAI